MLAATLPSRQDEAHHPIDYLGAGLLAGALTALVLTCTLGGNDYAWGSPQIIGLGVLAVVLIVGLRAGRAARRRAGAAAAAVSQPRVLRHQRDRPRGGLCPVRLGDLPAAVPAGRARRQPHRLGPADPAADGRPAHHLDRLRASSSAAPAATSRSRSPARRSWWCGLFLLSTMDARHQPRDGLGVHVRARPGPRAGDAGARAGGPERRRLQGPRRGHLGRDPVSLDRRLGRHRRARARSSPTGWPPSWRRRCRAAAPAARWAPAPSLNTAALKQAAGPDPRRLPHRLHQRPVARCSWSRACVAAVAFLLSWLLEQRPLRETVTASTGIGESFAVPKHDRFARRGIARHERAHRPRGPPRARGAPGRARRRGSLPAAAWLIVRLAGGRRGPPGQHPPALRAVRHPRSTSASARCASSTSAGCCAAIPRPARTAGASSGSRPRAPRSPTGWWTNGGPAWRGVCAGWQPEDNEELTGLLTRLARELSPDEAPVARPRREQVRVRAVRGR